MVQNTIFFILLSQIISRKVKIKVHPNYKEQEKAIQKLVETFFKKVRYWLKVRAISSKQIFWVTMM